MCGELKKTIKAYQDNNFAIVRTRNKAPIVKQWQMLVEDKEIFAGNLATATEAGFVIPDNIVVIDVDPRNFATGKDSLAELEKEIGYNLKQECNFVVNTASGGLHLYFKKKIGNKLPKESTHKGVEFKQRGQQVIIPNSKLPDKRQYTTNHLPEVSLSKLLDLPQKFYDVIGTAETATAIKDGVGFKDNECDVQSVRKLLLKTEPAIEGNGGDEHTFKVCCYGKDYGLSPEVFFDLLCEWNERCEPSWNLQELQMKMINAYNYSHNATGSHSVEQMFQDVENGFQMKILSKEDAKKQEEDLLNWEDELQLNKSGGIKITLKNTVLLIKNDENLKGKLGFNEFTNDIRWLKKPYWGSTGKFNTDFDGVKIRYLLNGKNFDVGKNLIEEAVVEISSHNSFHPVKDWLSNLPNWDGVKRIENLLIDNFNIEDNKYHREVMKLFFTGLLRRIYNPGSKFDMMFVLAGDTRAGKSTFLKTLAIKDDWFLTTQLKSLEPKDYVPILKNKLILEWQELAMFSRQDINNIKSFISTEIDTVREAYRRDATDYKRQFIICGTTNKDTFLMDETGNARFYIVKIRKKLNYDSFININGVEYIKSIYNNIKQIYAEALTFYKYYDLKLSEEASEYLEIVRDNSFSKDELEEVIIDWLDTIPEEGLKINDTYFIDKNKLQVQEIVIYCLKEQPGKSKLSTRIGNILRRLGYKSQSFRVGGKFKYGYVKKS